MRLRDFGPYEVFLMCVVITLATVMLLRNFGPYEVFLMCVLL
jgi:hypothetical protein